MAAACGMVLLRFFGRKSLLVTTQVFLIALLVCMYYFTKHELSGYMLWASILFVIMFEFGHGNITWLYMSEVCNNKATSVGTVMNAFWTLTVSLVTPFGLQDGGEKSRWQAADLWLVWATISFAGLLFLCLFMKETKGLSEKEVKRVYVKMDSQSNKNIDQDKEYNA